MHRTATVPAIWDEDVEPVGDIAVDRILAAISTARDAFWQSIGQSFPEVTTGDMAPGDLIGFEWATNEVVLSWLRWNHPSARDEA